MNWRLRTVCYRIKLKALVKNLSLSNEVEQFKDPLYCQAMEDGDGYTLYELDRARGDT
ncbi:hypothetical protein TUM4438_08560 [Shewanella sairae]|uniref:Uncharacterized protein n=1 Tax=Shewanella sairae TaxID=190310 RepID=A0ABQ4P447_9GAMM|nr:hypothetical protein TUM4438_08560 [Shewanella sairae]